MNNEHSYEKINAVKIIVENHEGKILLIQEPEMNEWMPGRWGLPGGRPKEKQSLKEAAGAKMQEDIGKVLPLSGIFKIEELLIDDRTVLMYIVVAKSPDEFTPGGKAYAYKWVGWEDVEKMQIEEFTEFYSRGLFEEYFKKPKNLVPFDIVDTHTYYLFSGESEYMRWWGREK